MVVALYELFDSRSSSRAKLHADDAQFSQCSWAFCFHIVMRVFFVSVCVN